MYRISLLPVLLIFGYTAQYAAYYYRFICIITYCNNYNLELKKHYSNKYLMFMLRVQFFSYI